MAGRPQFPPVPNPPPAYAVEWANRVATSLNVAMGKVNNGADLTLDALATSTVMKDARLSAFSVLTFMPKTANAAIAKAALWVGGQKKGEATIHHASAVATDQTFGVGIHA